MSAHDCTALGHVTVDADPECLICGQPTVQGDKTLLHIDRGLGELTDPRSVANVDGPDGWGKGSYQ